MESHAWLLCHGDKPVKMRGSDDHGYKIYEHSPLGKAMFDVKEAYEKLSVKKPIFLCYDDITSDPASLPFHRTLNVEKEWIFRTLFSLADERIGKKTIGTFQAFPIQMKYDGNKFSLHTLVSGCKNGVFHAGDVVHKHCFCLCGSSSPTIMAGLMEKSQNGSWVSAKAASKVYKKDIKTFMERVIEANKSNSKTGDHFTASTEVGSFLGGDIESDDEDGDSEAPTGVFGSSTEEALGAQLLNAKFS